MSHFWGGVVQDESMGAEFEILPLKLNQHTGNLPPSVFSRASTGHKSAAALTLSIAEKPCGCVKVGGEKRSSADTLV